MTHVALHEIPYLLNRQLLPLLGNIDLQREVVRINRADGLAKMNKESLLIRPNHHEFNAEHSKIQANRKIREHVCCEGRCNTHCTYKRKTREPYYPS